MLRGLHIPLLALALCPGLVACYAPDRREPAHTPAMRALERVEQALDAARDGDHARALVLLDEAIEADPAYAVPYRDKALVLADLGRFEDAVAAMDRAIEQAPDDPEAHLARGVFLERTGAVGRAKEAYAEAVRLYEAGTRDPARDLRHGLGLAHARYLMDGLGAGVRAVDEVLRRYPDNTLALAYRHRMITGMRDTFLMVRMAHGNGARAETTENEEEE
jgi:tetratricopeptide (TPR) repeat protein